MRLGMRLVPVDAAEATRPSVGVGGVKNGVRG